MPLMKSSIKNKRLIPAVLFISTHAANTNPQFATGPQKWVVLGPIYYKISFALWKVKYIYE